MKTPSLFLLVAVLLANAALGAWSSAPPGAVQSGQSYSMGAVHSGNATTVVVVILKDGASVAGNGTGGSPAQMRSTSCSYTSTDSGDKSIVYEQQGWSNATGNYVMDTRSTATTTVSKITPTITWTTPVAITYGTALSATQQNATANVAGTFSYSPISGTKPDAGSRTLTVTFTPTDTTNYRTATKTVTLTVKKAPLTITAVNKTRTYGAANPAFTVTYSGFVNGDTAAMALTGAPGFTTSAATASAVGSYTITPTVGTLAAANYTFTFVNGTLTVNKATLTVTAVNTTRIYGSSSPALTVVYSGFHNSETASVLTGAPSLTTVAATASVGTYPIDVAQGTLAAANYTFSFVDGTLTVSKATLTVTAANKSRVYGDAAAVAFTFAYSGFKNSDTAAMLTGAPSLTTAATVASPVGTYPIDAAQGTLAAANYTFSFIDGTLTVTKAPLTVKADNKTVVRLATMPAFTASYTGFVNGDTKATALSGSPSLSSTGNASSAAGTYPIAAAAGTLTATNYAFTFVNGILTILPFATTTLGNSVPGNWPNQAGSSTNAVGLTAGSLNVDKSGALTYSIPLWVTPGTAGMQPQLALNYSSQAGAGIAGFGWSLGGVSAISRGPQTRAVDGVAHGVDFTSADRFYLDGQRLVYIGGGSGYGTNGAEYRTEIDSFSRIISYGTAGTGPAYFRVWTKAGLIIEFGNDDSTTRAALTASGRSEILSWSVSKISDTLGNYMTFTYYRDVTSGEQRLTRIDYTGNTAAGVATYASVRFTYQARNDTFSGYIYGSKISRTQRLDSIGSYHGSTLVRKYTLEYADPELDLAPSDGLGRSMLVKLHEADGAGKAYPPLVFDYDKTVAGVDLTQTWDPPVALAKYNDTPRGVGFLDLNGDGRPDLIQYRVDSAGATLERGAWLNTVSGWTAASGAGTAASPDFRPPVPLAREGSTSAASRIADVNGDGLPDFFGPRQVTSQNTEARVFLNTGSGFAVSSAWTPPLPAPYGEIGHSILDTSYTKPEFVDLNGDSRPDLVAEKVWVRWIDDFSDEVGTTTLTKLAWLNTGSGWALTTGYYPRLDMEKGSRFVDVNGDGLPDQVQHWRDGGTVMKGVALNTGSGWSLLAAGSAAETRFVPPAPLNQNAAGSDGASVGTELVDLNGDGLVDLIHRNDTGSTSGSTAWLNTGYGWVTAPSAHLSPFELTNDYTPQGVAILDVNSDGLLDLVQAWNAGREVRLGTGNGWSASASAFNVWRQIAQGNIGYTGTDFIDLNADGAIDQIWNFKEGSGSTTAGTTINRAKPAGRLTKVTNGFGVSATIAYAPLTERTSAGAFTVYDKGAESAAAPAGAADVIGPMYVVKTVTNDDGAGGQYPISYRYGGLRSDYLRGSLGFAVMAVTDGRTNIKKTTKFDQAFPLTGMPYEVTTETSAGVVLSKSTMDNVEKTLNSGKTHLPYVRKTIQLGFELDGTFVSGTETTIGNGTDTGIDDFGNTTLLTVISLQKSGLLFVADGFKKTTTSTYYNLTDATHWFLGRLLTSTVVAVSPGKPTLTRKSSFAYDLDADAAAGVVAAPAGAVPLIDRTGLLTQEVVEPGHADAKQTLTTDYTYDQSGNKISVTVSGWDVDIAGTERTTSRTTSTLYDAKGRFPDNSTNALGHTESYTYDQALGAVKTLTGPNGLTTSWDYDTFGAKIKETRADGTVTEIRVRWAGANSPAGTKYFVETESTGGAPSLAFHDAFGRVFRTQGLNGAGDIVYHDTLYDAKGRAYAASVPYRNDGSPVYWTQTTLYDLLNRPKTVQTPDDQAANGYVTTTYAYLGLTTEVTDAKGHVARTIKNSQGWVTSAARNTAAAAGAVDKAAVTYGYDSFGNLLTTTVNDLAATAAVLQYDIRDRKTQMDDPDMGVWTYVYNSFGELVSQTDAKTQITRMEYDALGRLVKRNEAEGLTQWTYDTVAHAGAPSGAAATWVGKLASVSAPDGYAESYTYDAKGRPQRVKRTIDGTDYSVSQYYDAKGRPERVVYPTGFQIKNVYNGFGAVVSVRQTDGALADGTLYWQADHYAVDGRIDGETYGNGLSNDRVYSKATGRLLTAAVGLAPANGVQYLTYTYDQIGNVATRADGPTSRSETFTYDGLDRLKSQALSGGSTVSVTYDALGNIKNKSDNGASDYAYSGTNAGPHAVTSAGGNGYTYDANGNMLTRTVASVADRTLTWTSFNQVKTIVQGSATTTFSFGAAHERVKQVATIGATTTIYVGGLFEKVTSSSGSEEKNYILTPTGRTAVYTAGTTSLAGVRYFHTDGLGSITAVSNESGIVVQRFAYDAWGKRINPSSGAAITASTNGRITRGYTDHEHLDDFGLIHMNGRVYDPVLGRFLSADPFVGGVGDNQDYNRYSYLGNNPLGGTDPSGYFSLKDGLKIVGAIVAGIVTAGVALYAYAAVIGATFTGGLIGAISSVGLAAGWGGGWAIAAGAGFGFGSAFAGSLLNGGSIGDAFKAGVVGGIVGGITAGALQGINKIAPDWFDNKLPGQNDRWFTSERVERQLARIAARSTVNGAATEAMGGRFKSGFAFSAIADSVKFGSEALMEWRYRWETKNVVNKQFDEYTLSQHGNSWKTAVGDAADKERGESVAAPWLPNVGMPKNDTAPWWTKEGGPLGGLAKKVPGMNNLGLLHDYWATTVHISGGGFWSNLNYLTSQATIQPFLAFNYAILTSNTMVNYGVSYGGIMHE